MNRADHNYLNQLETQLRAMHQPHECPSHDLAFDEDDFERVFGVGDEQYERQASIYKDPDESGHARGDFA